MYKYLFGPVPSRRLGIPLEADYWNLDNVEIIKSAPSRKNIQSYRKDIESTILETISRRTCTLDDLSQIRGKHINEVNK